jgi:hypothetical protein
MRSHDGLIGLEPLWIPLFCAFTIPVKHKKRAQVGLFGDFPRPSHAVNGQYFL